MPKPYTFRSRPFTFKLKLSIRFVYFLEGSQLLHPKNTTSLMALHPKGKKLCTTFQAHYISNDTTSKKPLRLINHYITCITSSHNAPTSHVPLHPICHCIPQYYYIPCTTSSHMSLHPICHLIPYVTSSHMPLHLIGHFIP